MSDENKKTETKTVEEAPGEKKTTEEKHTPAQPERDEKTTTVEKKD